MRRKHRFDSLECSGDMCERCVKEEFPDRDTLCLEDGAFMMNFLKCCLCGRSNLKTGNRSCTELDQEEIITYHHVCGGCGHVIAEHEHIFKVEEDFQIYEMSCMLCGTAEDQRSIMPIDPRGPAM